MALVAFDTLKYAERLEKAGFPRVQAVELAEVQSETLADLMQEKLATKEDLTNLRLDLKAQIDALKLELHESNGALKIEMSALKIEMSTLKIEMHEANSVLLRWIIGLFVSGIGILSAIMSLFKFFQSS